MKDISIFLEDLLLCSKAMENDGTTVETASDICKSIDTSKDANDKTASTENDFKIEPKEETIDDECKLIISFILNLVWSSTVCHDKKHGWKKYETLFHYLLQFF